MNTVRHHYVVSFLRAADVLCDLLTTLIWWSKTYM